MNTQQKPYLPLILLFVILNGFFLTAKTLLAKYGIDRDILLIANSSLFILSMITFIMQKRALNNTNPNVFMRAMMGGIMLKMLLFATVIVVYVLFNRDTFNKQSIFISMLLYLIYLYVEVKLVLKLNKKNG